ncbi:MULTISPECIES: CcoQ/FixQ family Cbb3-type cytochrome c oxidase assembly chaperone [Rhodobacterales]|jgi:cytochrome c oxidase cbb3-type subunit 4|uniref:Cytochrome C oxidase n=1 Tax=Phaeobacter gallaeciensis TaxID=60890 RepID=A0A1B0ZQ35_9RHOB|nr:MULTISPECIES: CcoQ/FixQ family Cbb3-type cytochrome c oxidase assembly chaperone [Phaeobacter]MDF1772224.1 CcoQ/FixQ family Cbb3-type cytochrome c oxidase assembly chaperone [Pseudophaeobacter sp. bin_em_oilr2.035]ANP36282.1 cytochrome C oxidase [Phaeobacter gallaeciensis]MDE4060754.1 CcoQ/FixQ family Cbb3-type cytochrome c oxidase assembly chaperone [Phaeobacter gallaeciensis]MDE4097404.1 CcoQ/FixQ family Cbb3-type cytochrome c oxidase assembly chaperone [Phaeobacter gallaeciensis]MDE41060
MEEYTLLRQFADSWMLLMLFAFFIGVVVWVFRPGSNRVYRDTADIPFRHDDKPAPAKGKAKEART